MRKRAGDIIYTYRINVSEIQRTNKFKGDLHPFLVVVDMLRLLLHNLDPAVTSRSAVWNGVEAGSLDITIVPEPAKRRGKERAQ
jgi:hypothetical protein